MNNNNNSENSIIITYNNATKIPYFEAMASFYNVKPGTNIVLERNNSGFSDREFDALKSILTKKTTENYEMAMFLRNYLQLPEEYQNIYDPTVNIPVLKQKRGYYPRMTKRKYKNYNKNNNNNNYWKLTKEEMENAYYKMMMNKEKEAELEELANIIQSNSASKQINAAKAIRSKYPKSGKRPSKTSKKTSTHRANKYMRQTLRKLNRKIKNLNDE